MADIKISEMDPADQANVDDLLEASQVSGPGYVTKHISLDQVSTVVAASDQITEVIDAAIGEIPPPPPNDWASITGKPATFPPTVPIAYSDISGKPSTFPPTLPIAQSGVTNLVSDLALKAPLASPALTGNPTAPTPTPGDNDTSVATTAFVTAALAAGASIAVGTTPPVSPATNQLWWNSDAAVGGGQMFIWYNDGNTTQWVPASPGMATPTTPGGDFCASTGTGVVVTTTGAVWTGGTILSGTGGYYNTTNGRFTPPAGRYSLSGFVSVITPSGASQIRGGFRKNGTNIVPLSFATSLGANYDMEVSQTLTVDANGSDYFEWYIQSANSNANSNVIAFSAFPLSGVKGPPGDPGVGLLQTVSFQTGAVATGTTLIPGDDTIPQITEGNEYMTLAITPRSATSKLVIDVTVFLATTAGAGIHIVALFQDSIVNALAVGTTDAGLGSTIRTITFTHAMTSGTTSTTTFRVRAGGNSAGTVTFNGQAGARLFGGTYASSIVIQEVL